MAVKSELEPFTRITVQEAHEMIEKGRASLTAYRRVILPESIPAALFNRKS